MAVLVSIMAGIIIALTSRLVSDEPAVFWYGVGCYALGMVVYGVFATL